MAGEIVDVVVFASEVHRLRTPQSVAMDEMRRAAKTQLAIARAQAPVARSRTHGRMPGYLRSRIHLVEGADARGAYIDIVSDAMAVNGWPYGAIYAVNYGFLPGTVARARRFRSAS